MGKKYSDSMKLIDRTKQYDPEEAIALVKQTAKAKFDETIEISVRLGVDPRHADQQVRGAVVLPNGTGKTVRVLAFVKENRIEEAKAAGADLLFLPMYYTPASLILAEAQKQSYAPKFFGVDGMDGILTLEGFDTSLAEGVMLLTPFVASATDERTQAFVAAYKEAAKTDEDPIQFAADAYDCVKAIAQAIEAAGITPDMATADMCDKLIETFTGDFEFSGLTCPVGEVMTWSETGEVTKDPKGMVIQGGVYQPIA